MSMDLVENDLFRNPVYKSFEGRWRNSRHTLNSLIDFFLGRADLEEKYACQMETLCQKFPKENFDEK